MVKKINDDWLYSKCGALLEGLPLKRAFDVREAFGELAKWCLKREVLNLAESHAHALFPDQPEAAFDAWKVPRGPAGGHGACWVVLVNKLRAQLPLLRPAWVLPLRWQKGRGHHSHLPAGLLTVADNALSALQRAEDVKDCWGLVPSPGGLLDEHDLSELEGDYGSVWAPLAAGLLLAAWNGKPDPTIWASGAWKDNQGVLPVDSLEAKLTLAAEFGAKMFFVPATNLKDARQYAKRLPCFHVCAIAEERRPTDILRDYRVQLRLRPAPDDPKEERRAYYLDRPTLQDAQQYYLEDILPDVVKDCCRKLDESWPRRSIAALVTTVSGGTELIDLAVRGAAAGEVPRVVCR